MRVFRTLLATAGFCAQVVGGNVKTKIAYLFLVFVALPAPAAPLDLRIESFTREGDIAWSNAYTSGVCTVESVPAVAGPWQPRLNLFTTNSIGQARLPLPATNLFYRLLAVDVSTNTSRGYANLLASYGVLRTVAGDGQVGTDGINAWQPAFEAGPATAASLSRPHFAMADAAGNIFIADKDSHAILKVTLDGNIHTVAGTHAGGFNGDGPDRGTNLKLLSPNGEWVRRDGTVYILDTGNGKVRRLGTDGVMTTLLTVAGAIPGGRGLWVNDDESVVYYGAGTALKKWTPGGVKTLNNDFTELGNFVVDSAGNILATDRGAHKVYRVDATGGNTGGRTRIAGNGTTGPVVDGTPALDNGLHGVRGIWPLPTGGYLLATHAGSQILYVDLAGILHVFVDGRADYSHSGDDEWFHSPGYKISEVRSVTMDFRGNILITESDFGYVRQIEFRRLAP